MLCDLITENKKYKKQKNNKITIFPKTKITHLNIFLIQELKEKILVTIQTTYYHVINHDGICLSILNKNRHKTGLIRVFLAFKSTGRAALIASREQVYDRVDRMVNNHGVAILRYIYYGNDDSILGF